MECEGDQIRTVITEIGTLVTVTLAARIGRQDQPGRATAARLSTDRPGHTAEWILMIYYDTNQ